MVSSATGAPRALYVLCAITLLLTAVAPGAAAQEAGGGAVRMAVASAGESEIGELRLIVGRSALVNVGHPITRVSLTKPEIADAVVTGAQQILVHGKMPGTISMFVWDRAGGTRRYDVIVGRDLTELKEQMKQLFPGEDIAVTGNGKTVALSGAVSSKYIIEKAPEVAAAYVERKEDVVNLLRQQEGIATNQVMLRVRFAEVNRSAMTELGVSIFSDGNNNTIGRSTTQQFAAPFFDQQNPMVGKNLVFSDYLNLFLFNSTNQIGLTIRALQNRGLLQSLAEPNLIAENGKEASFLAGGEYPYPVAQGAGSNLMVTIVFKEYGIRLSFTPTLKGGDLIHLKVRPEVSSLDFANAITYQGFRIPALSTRRAETEVELQDGQTFAIAGLINNSVASSMQKIPGIGDIPILGNLFRSKGAQKSQTELVVMITPQILRRGSMGAAPGLPSLAEPYLPPPAKILPSPPPRMPGVPMLGQDTTAAAAGTPAAIPAAANAAPTSGAAPAPQVPAATPPAPVAPAAGRTAPAAPPAAAAVAPPAPVPAPSSTPTADPKNAAVDKKAADKAAAARAEADRKAQESAQKELKKKQEADGRLLAKQQAAEAERKQDEAKKAEAQRQVEAKRQAEQRKIDAKKAQEQLKAEQRRLEAAKKEAAEARKQEDRLKQERARRDSALSKQQADAQKKQLEAEKKRYEEIRESEERLRAAQTAYAAALERVRKAGGQ